jgi:hypothetical protein
MRKVAKNKASSNKKDQEKATKSKAVNLAEELVMTSSDNDVTTDEAVTISAGRPPNGQFFMAHPTTRGDIRLLKRKVGVKEDRYVVMKSVAAKLDYVTPSTAFLCTTLEGTPFLWLIGVGDDTWSTSARRIAVDAMSQWVRLVPHNNSGTYHKRVAKSEERKPDFKGLDQKPFIELLLMAFDEYHVIKTMDHPVAQQVASGE